MASLRSFNCAKAIVLPFSHHRSRRVLCRITANNAPSFLLFFFALPYYFLRRKLSVCFPLCLAHVTMPAPCYWNSWYVKDISAICPFHTRLCHPVAATLTHTLSPGTTPPYVHSSVCLSVCCCFSLTHSHSHAHSTPLAMPLFRTAAVKIIVMGLRYLPSLWSPS